MFDAERSVPQAPLYSPAFEHDNCGIGAVVNIKGKKMGGKTGTSQVRSISKAERLRGVLTNEQLKWNMRNHGLFVGYAPLDKPKYAVCVITEHSGGSGSAARSAAATMRVLLRGDL